ncbi:MAG: hypothetical protein ACJAVY_002041, partial [Marinoscillum sp.]
MRTNLGLDKNANQVLFYEATGAKMRLTDIFLYLFHIMLQVE